MLPLTCLVVILAKLNEIGETLTRYITISTKLEPIINMTFCIISILLLLDYTIYFEIFSSKEDQQKTLYRRKETYIYIYCAFAAA